MKKRTKAPDKSKDTTFADLPWEVRKGLDLKATPETGRQIVAGTFTDPALAASKVIHGATPAYEAQALDMNDLVASLKEHAQAVSNGDMSRVEAILLSQAEALQSLFTRLSTRGMAQQYLDNFNADMKLALRAQSQCRATLETLATIKNPPVVFAKQANIAHGHQQVNNTAGSPARGENENLPSKLLERSNEDEWLDGGAPVKAGKCYSTLEAVAEVNRAAHARRERPCEL